MVVWMILKKNFFDILMLEMYILMFFEGFIFKGKICIDCFKNIIV